MSNLVFKNISIGTAGLAGIWGQIDEKESVNAILYALENGITSFDTAPSYNNAQEILGEALRQWKGQLPFISTKCGRLKSSSANTSTYDYSKDGITRSVESSLEILGLDQVDVLFLHDPTLIDVNMIGKTIDHLIEIREKGYAKQLGIGGNYNADFKKFINNKVFSVFMGYNRFNIITQDAQDEEFKLLAAEDIKIWQASPLYNGLLGSNFENYRHNKPEWIPTEHINKTIALNEYCKKNGTEMAEMALRFLKSAQGIDRTVIGPKNLSELKCSMKYWSKDDLSVDILTDIKELL